MQEYTLLLVAVVLKSPAAREMCAYTNLLLLDQGHLVMASTAVVAAACPRRDEPKRQALSFAILEVAAS